MATVSAAELKAALQGGTAPSKIRTLEELRVLWRLVNQRGWISQQQLVFVQGKLDEAGRMVGGWSKAATRA